MLGYGYVSLHVFAYRCVGDVSTRFLGARLTMYVDGWLYLALTSEGQRTGCSRYQFYVTVVVSLSIL